MNLSTSPRYRSKHTGGPLQQPVRWFKHSKMGVFCQPLDMGFMCYVDPYTVDFLRPPQLRPP